MRCPSCGNENRAGARFCDSCGTPLEAATEGSPVATPTVPEAGPEPPEAAPLPAGSPDTVGDGRFELVGFLGEGTRKRVYLARDLADGGRYVALALFNTESMGATAQARARRELDTMSRLGEDPHLVAVIASGEEAGRPYIASEYMPGGDLAELLAGSPDNRLEAAQAIGIAAGIAAGLESAHGCGVVHRDIKPANIWLDRDGSARLGDFGLASSGARSREAVEGMLVGTVAYLPPEQAIGRGSDPRADLYSLGAVLYEMLAGRPPFEGDDPVAIISGHLSAEPVPPSQLAPALPATVDELVACLLAKTPADRPAHAREVRERLEAIAADPGAPAAATEGPANPLDALAGGIFVGRESEFGELTDALEAALDGRGGVAMVEGEPGIGKSRLVDELATYARVRGARVLSSRSQEAETPAYWPFAEAIRSYVRDADPVGLAWQLGSDGPEVARLLPELRERIGSIAEPPPIDTDDARFRFFDGIAGFLTGAAASRPIVLILDDLHWADTSSLELLEFLARRLGGHPILLVVAHRSEDAARRPALRRVLSALDEFPGRHRIELRGLDRQAIGRFVELTAGSTPPADLVEEIAEQTGGNPFFVGEVVRLIVSGGGIDTPRRGGYGLPGGVREAVARRLAALPDGSTGVLEAAAVLGREFDPEILARIAGPGTRDAIGAAVAARILVPAGERERGRFSFAHAVFREALYDGLDSPRRVELHLAAGQAIERAGAGPTALPALARHFFEAGEAGDPAKALDYSLRAGRQAASALAHADAAEHLERALRVASAPESANGGGPALEVEIGLELGDEMTRCGRFADAREAFERAFELAGRSGDAIAQGEAALGASRLSEAGSLDGRLVRMLDTALDALGDREPVLRSRLMSGLVVEYQWEDPEGVARQISDRAHALALEQDDPLAIAESFSARQFLSAADPEGLASRLSNSEQLIVAARRAGDGTSEVRGHAFKLTALMQMGDVEAADRELAEVADLAAELREPRHLWHIPFGRAAREIMRGHFDSARALGAEGARLGALAEEPLAAQFVAVQHATIDLYEGNVAEMLPVVRRMAERYPGIPAWRLSLIHFLVVADRVDEARAEYEPLARRGFETYPRDANWLVGMARVARSAAALGDVETCARLYEMLLPFSGEVVVVARAVVCDGPLDVFLGILADAQGRQRDAIAHLESGIALAERMGDRPNLAEARMRLGASLIARDHPGDRERALEVLGAALEDGLELGMRALVEQAIRARLEAQGVAGVGVTASIDSVASAVAAERPDLAASADEQGRISIVFSDIENSTLMTERLGDERWIEVLRDHNAIFRSRLTEHGGTEVKNQGDGFMLVFSDPLAALGFATTVQRDLAEREAEEGERIRVRIGMHVGEAIQEDGDFFGRSVILAARIAAQARGGEILTSAAVCEAGSAEHEFDEGRELELKGLAGTHLVHRVGWERQPAAA